MYTSSGYTRTSPGGITTEIGLEQLSNPMAANKVARAMTALYGVPCGVVSAAPGELIGYPDNATLDYLAINIPGVADGVARNPINAVVLLAMDHGGGEWRIGTVNRLPIYVDLPQPAVAALQPDPNAPPLPMFGGASTAAAAPNAALFARLDKFLTTQGL